MLYMIYYTIDPRLKQLSICRTIGVRSDPNDFHTQPAGNAGKKIACGVIQRR